MSAPGTTDLATLGVHALVQRRETLATAESLTGGLLASLLVEVPGASRMFAGGVVAYDTRLKTSLLGVRPEVIASHTVVSEQVAHDMAQGVCSALGTPWGLATTGEAGPTSATGKPVGLLWVACAGPDRVRTASTHVEGGREQVRRAACHLALTLLAQALGKIGAATS